MISDKLQRLHEQIAELALRCGRSERDIRLIAVSKTRGLSEVEAAIQAGQLDFGENTIQEALTKIPHTQDSGACWHFIGHLQSKKARYVPGHFQWIHSIDSIKLVRKLDAAIAAAGTGEVNCLLQVNHSGEPTKSGLMPGEVEAFFDEVLGLGLRTLRWRGLMTIGVQDDPVRTRKVFADCRRMQRQLAGAPGLEDFDQLSMGMSADYADAIAEGATMIRVGTAIFGERRNA